MWHRYAKRTIGWLCPSSSRCKEVRSQLQRDQRRTFCTMCTCEEIERGTHACNASKLGPVKQWWTQDGKLGITITDPSPESGRRTYLLCFTYSYYILSRVWKLATDTMNIYFCLLCENCTWRCHGFAYICQIFISSPLHFHMHIQRHTHTSTHVQSAHKRNGDNQAQEPGWEGRTKGFY